MKCAHLARKVLFLVLTSGFFVATCLAQVEIFSTMAPVVRLTVTPGISSPVFIKVLPNAECALQTDGLNDAAHTLKLFADQEGMVHFHAHPPSLGSTSQYVVGVVLQCRVGSIAVTYPIELRASFSSTLDFPPPIASPRPVGTIRPALTVDQLNLSNEELLKAGYPIRPDPKQAPQAYQGWLAAVARPTTVVSSQTVSRPGVKFGPTAQKSDTTWSGFELLQAFGQGSTPEQYQLVAGFWIVPAVQPFNWHVASALWIGLDDDSGTDPQPSPTCPGCLDLLQEGTAQEAIMGCSPGGCILIEYYFAWYEQIFSSDFNPPVNLSQVVNPGDIIFAEVYVANCNALAGRASANCGMPDPTGQSGPTGITSLSGVYYIQDLTAGWTAPLSAVPLVNGKFSGLTAEWIMERPTGLCGDPNLICDLADYGHALLLAGVAQTHSGTWVSWNANAPAPMTATNWQFFMVGCSGPSVPNCPPNQADLLSSADPPLYQGSIVIFNWHGLR